MARKGRGRLSSIQLLPQECNQVVMWAAAELQENARTQLEIYKEFSGKLEALQRESRGELEFTIPSFSAFNRYSINLDAMTRDLNETREMAAAISDTFDPEESDDLTLVAAEAIKALIFTMLRTQRGKIGSKDAKALADALRSATHAQSVSTARRDKIEAKFKAQAEKAIEKVSKEKGMSAEVVAQLRRDFLGVKPKQKKDAA
ncbi:UNVERIFIED_ORG: Lhr-like helicase [Rhizobium etli]